MINDLKALKRINGLKPQSLVDSIVLEGVISLLQFGPEVMGVIHATTGLYKHKSQWGAFCCSRFKDE